jgi:hypothetical protein
MVRGRSVRNPGNPFHISPDIILAVQEYAAPLSHGNILDEFSRLFLVF